MDKGKEQMKTSLVILFKGMSVIKYSKNLENHNNETNNIMRNHP